MDESRKQFEDWVKFHLGDDWSEVSMHTANGGANYKDSYVDLAWIAWQASREAIVIELPEKMVLVGLEEIDRTLTAINAGMAMVESVVRAAGIKVKE